MNGCGKELFLHESRAEFLSQEGQNREFSTKAGGMAALAVALFGGVALRGPDVDDVIGTLLLVAFVLLTGLVVVLAATVLRPEGWRRPHDLAEVRAVTDDSEKRPVAEMHLVLAEGYERAVTANWRILDGKAKSLKRTTSAILGAVATSLLIFVHGQWPEFLPGIVSVIGGLMALILDGSALIFTSIM